MYVIPRQVIKVSCVLSICLAHRESIEIITLVLLVVILFRLLLCSGKIVLKVDSKSTKVYSLCT